MRKPFVSSLKEEERAPADRSREGRGYRGMNQQEQGFSDAPAPPDLCVR